MSDVKSKAALLLLTLTFMFSFILFFSPEKKPQTSAPALSSLPKSEFSKAESKRVGLYVTVMTKAFDRENGGKSFIAVDLDSLKGLSEAGKNEVLKKLSGKAKSIYRLSDVKTDWTKFKISKHGNRVRAINGTVLSVRVESDSEDKVILWGESWFGNLGAVMIKYEATYENGTWTLKEAGFAIS